MPRPPVPLTVDDIRLMLDRIRGEAMELMELAPDSVRSEFGAGMVHGFLKAANRFGTLCDEHLQQVAQKEEEFERDFGLDDAKPLNSGRFRRPDASPRNGEDASNRQPQRPFGRPL